MRFSYAALNRAAGRKWCTMFCGGVPRQDIGEVERVSTLRDTKAQELIFGPVARHIREYLLDTRERTEGIQVQTV